MADTAVACNSNDDCGFGICSNTECVCDTTWGLISDFSRKLREKDVLSCNNQLAYLGVTYSLMLVLAAFLFISQVRVIKTRKKLLRQLTFLITLVSVFIYTIAKLITLEAEYGDNIVYTVTFGAAAFFQIVSYNVYLSRYVRYVEGTTRLPEHVKYFRYVKILMFSNYIVSFASLVFGLAASLAENKISLLRLSFLLLTASALMSLASQVYLLRRLIMDLKSAVIKKGTARSLSNQTVEQYKRIIRTTKALNNFGIFAYMTIAAVAILPVLSLEIMSYWSHLVPIVSFASSGSSLAGFIASMRSRKQAKQISSKFATMNASASRFNTSSLSNNFQVSI